MSTITPTQAISNASRRLQALKAEHQEATAKLQSLRSEHTQRPALFHNKEIAAWLEGERVQNTEERARLEAGQRELEQEIAHLEKEIIPGLRHAQAEAERNLLLTKVQSAAQDVTHALQDWQALASPLLAATEHLGFRLGTFYALERRYVQRCQQIGSRPEVLPKFEDEERDARDLVRNTIFALWQKGADAGQARGDNEQ